MLREAADTLSSVQAINCPPPAPPPPPPPLPPPPHTPPRNTPQLPPPQSSCAASSLPAPLPNFGGKQLGVRPCRARSSSASADAPCAPGRCEGRDTERIRRSTVVNVTVAKMPPMAERSGDGPDRRSSQERFTNPQGCDALGHGGLVGHVKPDAAHFAW